MAFDKLMLIDVLRGLATRQHRWNDSADLEDRIRGTLLLASTHSPDNCESVDRVGYSTFVDDSTGAPFEVRGLSLPEADCMIFDVIDALLRTDTVPAAVTAGVGDVSLEDYHAALFTVLVILNALQWSEHDDKKPMAYSEERQDRALAASLRALFEQRELRES